MHHELKVFLKVGTATCMSLTEDFADMEDTHPMWAHQLQEMLDLGWELKFPPYKLGNDHIPCFKHTFMKKRNG